MNDVVRVFAIALLLSCLPIGATIGAGAAGSTGSDQPASIAAAATAQDNETVRHRRPDEYADERGTDRLEVWLSNRLTEQLQNSTRALSEGEYDLAREYLGEEYRERYEQYVEVAGDESGDGGGSGGDGDGSGDAGDAAVFEETASEQARLVDLVETYDETAAEYERARDAGDEDRARELARELDDLAAEIEAVGGTVATNYETITVDGGESSGSSESAASVRESVSEVQRTQAAVRTEQFVETDLVLDAGAERGSFSDPIPMRGELRTADGSTVANETVRLEIDGRPIDVRTDATGALDFEYRPTTQRLSATNVTVEYVPRTRSTYLGSEATVAAPIEQVEPTIDVLETADEIGYDESLAVEGSLSVDGVPVDGVELEVALGDEPIGTVNVTDGAFAESVRLPAAVPAGDRTLTVAFPHDDRALAATTATTSVAVAETETDLRLDVTPIDDAEFRVEGRLATIDGEGVPNQSVAVLIDGARVGAATTGSDGEFSERLSAPTPIGDEATLRAVYDDPETNLGAAETATSVRPPNGGGSLLGGTDSRWARLGGAIAVAGLGAALWWRRRRDSGRGESPRDVSSETGTGSGAAASTTRPDAKSKPADPALVDSLFDRAREHLSGGRPERAVRTCYAAVRRACATDPDGSVALTHWEFYRQYESEKSALDRDRLRDVTETYERAVFAPESISGGEAARFLDAARSLCDAETTRRSTEAETTAADD